MDISKTLALLGIDVPSTEEKEAEAASRGAECHRCPLRGTGPVLGEIRPNAKLIVVGEAPGRNETLDGRPFVGASGQVLEAALFVGGISRDETTLTNTLLCQPPEELSAYLIRTKLLNRPSPIECCAPRLKNDLEASISSAKVTLAVGAHALRAVADAYRVPFGTQRSAPGEPRINALKKQLGAPVVLQTGHVVMASYHPAFAMRKGSRQYRPVVDQHIARAARIATRGGGIDWREPGYFVSPTIEEVEAVLSRFATRQARVSVDIETSSVNVRTCALRCVGLGADIDGEELVISVPFRRIDGGDYWSPEDKVRAVAAVRRVLDACPLVGHNFAFDSAVLLRLGLMSDRRKTYDDSMLAHHDTEDNDLPHDLGFVSARYFEAPQWKLDMDAKSVALLSDSTLHQYNARDVLSVLRLMPELERSMWRAGTLKQYETDTRLAPICRDMGDLGLVVDRHERLRLLKQLTVECRSRIVQLKAMVGRPDFNPNASQHVRDYVYGTKGLRPVINTAGKEWKEDEDPSTNLRALLTLRDHYADDETRRFIDSLLEFRAYDKLRGTYVRNLDYVKEDWSWAGLGTLAVLHTNYKLHVIPSGRLSTAPAIQNWPERGKANMRRMITSPPGHVIVGADFDQLELRLYAVIAQDVPLLDAFFRGLDVHIWNYASLEAKHPDDIPAIYERLAAIGKDNKVVKQNRNIAKRFVYLELYGGEEDKLYEVMSTERDKVTNTLVFPDIKESDVKRWHENWHRWHPATRAWHQACLKSYYTNGYTASILDYRRRFHPGGLNKQNAVANHCIQSSGAALANRALLQIADAIPHRGWSPMSGPMLQVHDYIGVYVPESRADEACRIIEDAMSYTLEGLPITAKAKASRGWHEQ